MQSLIPNILIISSVSCLLSSAFIIVDNGDSVKDLDDNSIKNYISYRNFGERMIFDEDDMKHQFKISLEVDMCLNKGVCSESMAGIKAILIQQILDNCKQCSEKEKRIANKASTALSSEDPEAWKVFARNYGDMARKDNIRNYLKYNDGD